MDFPLYQVDSWTTYGRIIIIAQRIRLSNSSINSLLALNVYVLVKKFLFPKKLSVESEFIKHI